MAPITLAEYFKQHNITGGMWPVPGLPQVEVNVSKVLGTVKNTVTSQMITEMSMGSMPMKGGNGSHHSSSNGTGQGTGGSGNSSQHPEYTFAPVSYVQFFTAMQLIGGAGLFLVLATGLFSKRATRCATWCNYCFSWIIFSVAFSLQLGIHPPAEKAQSSGSHNHPPPYHIPRDFPLCLSQASLIYGARVLTSWTTFSLVMGLWLKTRNNEKQLGYSLPRSQSVPLLVLPYILAVSVMLQSILLGVNYPKKVKLIYTGLYCVVEIGNPDPATVSGYLTLMAAIMTVITEVWLGMWIRKAWTYANILDKRKAPPSFTLLVRPVLFSAVGIVTIWIWIFYHDNHDKTPNTFLAILPITALFIFGFRMDMLRVWMFWRKDTEPPSYKVSVGSWVPPKLRAEYDRDRMAPPSEGQGAV